MSEQIKFSVNGEEVEWDGDDHSPLLYLLRNDLSLNGPKFGCGLSQCGACTVVVGDKAVRSCVTPISSLNGAEVTTLEGIGTPDKPHPLQEAFIEEQAVQCGYCINGMIMTAKAFLDKTPQPSTDEIKEALEDNLCRCGTQLRIVRAVKRAAKAGAV